MLANFIECDNYQEANHTFQPAVGKLLHNKKLRPTEPGESKTSGG